MCIGMFMAVLDIQIVATSLPTIQADLGIRPDQMSWVQTSYLIAEVVAIPLTGLLTRALTMRWLSVATIAAFTLASAGCAFSGSFEALLVWRVVQGFAGGLLIPQVFSAGFALFPRARTGAGDDHRGRARGAGPDARARSSAAGSPTTYSWPWLFLVNIVPGILAAVDRRAAAAAAAGRSPGCLARWTAGGCCSWPWRSPVSRSA